MTDQPTNLATRLWCKDVSLWHTPGTDEAALKAGLGWLESIGWMQKRTAALQTWTQQIVESGQFTRLVVLGMGGASLTAAVFAQLFKPRHGYLPLTLIDTTHPHDIAQLSKTHLGDLSRCLFIVASKSATTVETLDLYQYFRAQLDAQCRNPHSRFVLITDAESPMHILAQSAPTKQFSKIFINPSDIGGRYSALSYFGMVPAALLGVDIRKVLKIAQDFCATTKSDTPSKNPALRLGMLLGRSALVGKDKLILQMPPELHALGQWIEQLVAESTGKNRKGIVPVVVGDSMDCGNYGTDCITIRIGSAPHAAAHKQLQPKPCAVDDTLPLDDPYQIGAEYFRWQVATVIAASYLRINPFDQPDVEQTKRNTRLFIDGRGSLPAPTYRGQHYDLYSHISPDAGTCSSIAAFHQTLSPNCYVALLVYLPQQQKTSALLHSLCAQITAKWQIVSTLGFAPRYLHSTGQLHKGGPPSGRFIQFVAEYTTDLAIPQRDYTFGQLHRAQADADFSALTQGGNVVLRVKLKSDKLDSLAAFISTFTNTEK